MSMEGRTYSRLRAVIPYDRSSFSSYKARSYVLREGGMRLTLEPSKNRPCSYATCKARKPDTT